jgi:hypothetical protein
MKKTFINIEEEMKIIKESMLKIEDYLNEYKIINESLILENNLYKTKIKNLTESLNSDKHIKKISNNKKKIDGDNSFEDESKICPSFCFITDYTMSLIIGDTGVLRISGRNKNEDEHFFANESVTVIFKKEDKILKQPYEVNFSESEATISYKIIHSGIINLLVSINGEKIGESYDSLEIEVKEEGKPSIKNSKQEGFNFSVCTFDKLAKFNFILKDEDNNILNHEYLTCELKTVEDDFIETLTKTEIGKF